MNKQPASRTCFVCGRENPVGLKIAFYDVGPGEVTADYMVPSHFQGYPGITHGGVIAAMLDELAGRTQMHDAPSGFMVTAQLDVRYRKPVPVEVPLKLVGKAVERKGRISKATGQIFGPGGQLLAEANVVMVDIPQADVDQMDVDNLGWMVYPDGEDQA